ncbi:MAG: uL15 family ribosomal protein, partial [Patescibacteria group bacterium]
MQFHNLKRIHPNKRSVAVGRGGRRGKTSGRGGKGQTARAGHKVRPEIRDLIKKLPKLRGRGKNINRSFEKRPVILNIDILEKKFAEGETV